VGLQGLLGYSSNGDDEDDAQPSKCGQAASIRQQELRLPSVAELLEQDMPSSFAPAPNAVLAVTEPSSPPVVGSGTVYQHHTGWI
jgi:hypothetical protein